MKITNSYELLVFLKSLGYLQNPPHPLWWPNAGNFEVVLGAIFVQNTKWEQAFKVLSRLKDKGILSLEALANISHTNLEILMSDLGFFRQKAQRSIKLCQNILEEFGNFENFCENVDREWLLAQKGIGNETCDSILCYGALRDEMVADKYSYKLLKSFGYELESYEEIKEWLKEGVLENFTKVCELYGYEISLNTLYARFHGKIVEYCKIQKF